MWSKIMHFNIGSLWWGYLLKFKIFMRCYVVSMAKIDQNTTS